MQETIVKELEVRLFEKLSLEDIRTVSENLYLILSDYDISKKETSIIEYVSPIPDLVKNYLLALKDFFINVNKKLEQITTNDVRVYLYKYQERKNVSKATVEQKRTIIHGFFEWAVSENYIPSNPVRLIKPIKYEKKERQALTQLELEKVRLQCKTPKEKAIIELLYSTGCRVSELQDLNVSDVNFETKEVSLFGKGSKHRTSYLNAKAEIALRQYLMTRKGTSEALFVSDKKPYDRIHKCGIEAIVKKIMGRVGLDVTKHITPHNFRHTMATTALDNGMPVTEISRLLGHTRLDTTMIYAKTNTNKIKESYRRCVI